MKLTFSAELFPIVQGVFVNPALVEPFGLTLIEAAAYGLPMVATKNGGPVDIQRVRAASDLRLQRFQKIPLFREGNVSVVFRPRKSLSEVCIMYRRASYFFDRLACSRRTCRDILQSNSRAVSDFMPLLVNIDNLQASTGQLGRTWSGPLY